MKYRRHAQGLAAASISLLLAACGGGGPDSSTPAVADAGKSDAALQPQALQDLTPAALTTNVAQGTSASLTISASTVHPAVTGGVVYAVVEDEARVMMPDAQLLAVDDKTVSITLHTRASLPTGRYQGTLRMRMCYDPGCAMLVSAAPVDVPYNVLVTDRPLVAAVYQGSSDATVHRGGVVPGSVNITVGGITRGWKATSSAAWLKLVGGSGVGYGSLTAVYDPRELAEGSYQATVHVEADDGQFADLPFSITVMPSEFVVRNQVPTFTAVNGAPILEQAVSFALDNGFSSDWSATTLAPWLKVSTVQGTTPAVLNLQPDPSQGPLASGTYSAEVVLTSSTGARKSLLTSITLNKATFSASGRALEFGGPKGRDLHDFKVVHFSLNTGSNAWPFTVSSPPAWLTSSVTAGTVGELGTTLGWSTVPQNIPVGTSSAVISVTSQVNGDLVKLPLVATMNADQRRLLASEWGVALSTSPMGTQLARTIEIRDNFELGLSWTATSDVPWLQVTPGGHTSGSPALTMQADASGLPMDAVSYANVTVTTAKEGVAPAVIRVAVWRGATEPTSIVNVPRAFNSVIADKIRPYVYASRSNQVYVYNAYTGTLVLSIQAASPTPGILGQMAVSADGSMLYALDTVNRNIQVFDFLTMRWLSSWGDADAVSTPHVQAMRINGVDVVLLGDRRAYVNGKLVSNNFVYGSVNGTADGRWLYPGGSQKFEVDYSAMSGGTLFKTLVPFVQYMAAGDKDYAISPDGKRVYGAGDIAEGGYGCAGGNLAEGRDLVTLPTNGYGNNVEVTRNGRIVCGVRDTWRDPDLHVYTQDGTLLKSVRVSGYNYALQERQMVVTPDGLVAAALTSEPMLAFIPLPP